MTGGETPGVGLGRVRRVVLARALPDVEGTPDHTVHLVTVPLSEDSDGSTVSGLCGTRLRRARIEAVAVGVSLCGCQAAVGAEVGCGCR
ncbi:MAG: hypothetical protein ACRDRV_05225 [Pseudonocardiaceae bacterium]